MKKFLLFLITIALSYQTNAQEIQRSVVCVNGNYINNGDLRVSQTIGEPIAETFNGPDLTTFVVQGFEQQFGSLLTVGIEDFTISANVYPNPTVDFVFLEFQQQLPLEVNVQVFGADGKFYFNQKLEQTTKVDLSQLAASTYFLRIVNEEKQTFMESITIQKVN